MNNLRQNPDPFSIEREIEKERARLMNALIRDESISAVSIQLKKVLELSEQKKNLKPLYISRFEASFTA